MQGKIVGYVAVGTNDLPRAKTFYDALLGETLGASSFSPNERSHFYQVQGGQTVFAVFTPYDEKEATAGNGSMVGFAMDSEEQIAELYNKAIELGAQDEGEPGVRAGTFNGAYVRDLDGNKLCFYKMG